VKDVILFTGQSGLKIRDGLKKLKRKDFQPTVFSVESEMQEISGKTFLEILSEPPRIQEALWAQSVEEIKGKLPLSPTLKQYVFLTFHASYYHQRKREFLSPVAFAKLSALKDRVKMVVVFIDDCYDIYRRLMGQNEMFAYIQNLSKSEPGKALLESITNLLSILEWREIEIAFSRKIAQLLEVPLYVMAVKHPSWMLSRMIESVEEQNIFYLSHPISSIVKGVQPRPSGFYLELNKFIEQVLAKKNRILFIPDTIDEKRIRQGNAPGQYFPELSEGWPLPFSNEWLFVPLPADVKRINPLNPANFDVQGAGEGFQAAVSVLLKALLEKISTQINSRDLTLVEQSKDGIILYRPYWGAVIPGGVEEELKYNSDLATDYGEKSRRAIIITTNEDMAKWRIKYMFDYIKNSISLDNTQVDGVNYLCENWLDDPEKLLQFGELDKIKVNEATMKKSIEKVLPPDYLFHESVVASRSSTLRSAPMLTGVKRQSSGWEKIFNSIPTEDPFKVFIVQKSDYISAREEELGKKLIGF